MLKIIPRRAWRPAGRSYALRPVDWPPTPLCVVHHSAGPEPGRHAELRQDLAVVRAIDNFHYYSRRWKGGVGYNYLVLPSGRIIEGRGHHHGAHTRSWNHLPGICVVGDYSHAHPTARAADSLTWLLREVLQAGQVKGHREVNPTSCPGATLWAMLDHILARRINIMPEPPPHGNTLRLEWITEKGQKRAAAGWIAVANAFGWFELNEFSGQRVAIAWRGHIWRGWRDVSMVWRTLENRFLEDR